VYTKEFKSSRYKSLIPILEEIQDLGDEGSFWIRNLTKRQAAKMRWLLYDWLHHMRLKNVFQIHSEGNSLYISRHGRLPEELDYNIETIEKES